MSISVPNNITAGQPQTMDCTMVAVRGITSRMDIVWYNNSIPVRRVNNVTASIINGTAAVYMDSFNISLTIKDDGIVFSCQGVINDELIFTIHSSIRLNVTCKFKNTNNAYFYFCS